MRTILMPDSNATYKLQFLIKICMKYIIQPERQFSLCNVKGFKTLQNESLTIESVDRVHV